MDVETLAPAKWKERKDMFLALLKFLHYVKFAVDSRLTAIQQLETKISSHWLRHIQKALVMPACSGFDGPNSPGIYKWPDKNRRVVIKQQLDYLRLEMMYIHDGACYCWRFRNESAATMDVEDRHPVLADVAELEAVEYQSNSPNHDVFALVGNIINNLLTENVGDPMSYGPTIGESYGLKLPILQHGSVFLPGNNVEYIDYGILQAQAKLAVANIESHMRAVLRLCRPAIAPVDLDYNNQQQVEDCIYDAMVQRFPRHTVGTIALDDEYISNLKRQLNRSEHHRGVRNHVRPL